MSGPTESLDEDETPADQIPDELDEGDRVRVEYTSKVNGNRITRVGDVVQISERTVRFRADRDDDEKLTKATASTYPGSDRVRVRVSTSERSDSNYSDYVHLSDINDQAKPVDVEKIDEA